MSIRSPGKEKRKQFLFSITGATALGDATLIIAKQAGLPSFHTCGNTAQLPLGNSEKEIFSMLERAIAGSEGFSIT